MDLVVLFIGMFAGASVGAIIMAFLTSSKVADLEHQLWEAEHRNQR